MYVTTTLHCRYSRFYVFQMLTSILRAKIEWNQEGPDLSITLYTHFQRQCDIVQNKEHLFSICVKITIQSLILIFSFSKKIVLFFITKSNNDYFIVLLCRKTNSKNLS